MRNKRMILRLVILIVWIVFIFSRSIQPGEQSTEESQWVLTFLQQILPFEVSMLLIRKTAHFTEFAVLGVLAERFFVKQERLHLESGLLSAVLVCVFTAMCDETIQLFVEGRAGMLQDAWLDTAGAVFGILVILAVQRLRNKRKKNQ